MEAKVSDSQTPNLELKVFNENSVTPNPGQNDRLSPQGKGKIRRRIKKNYSSVVDSNRV